MQNSHLTPASAADVLPVAPKDQRAKRSAESVVRRRAGHLSISTSANTAHPTIALFTASRPPLEKGILLLPLFNLSIVSIISPSLLDELGQEGLSNGQQELVDNIRRLLAKEET